MAEPQFELVVVADPAGLAVLDALPFDLTATRVAFDKPHLAQARNVGIAAAGGDVLAFLDDDAVAEPGWLAALTQPIFQGASAATGAVRGRNGLSFQTQGEVVNARAVVRQTATPESGETLKLIGTNMAISRAAMDAYGAFDPTLAFYLDDTELSWRLRTEDTRYVPEAVVHHRSAASDRRTTMRKPLGLFDVGRSIAIFLRRHADPRDLHSALDAHRADQRRRLVAHMVRGTAEPRDIGRLMTDLERGIKDGLQAQLSDILPPAGRESYSPWQRNVQPPVHLRLAHRLNEKRALEDASGDALKGHPTTVLSLTRTGLRHRMRYTDTGVWLQRGGTFGRSDRNRGASVTGRLNQCAEKETKRLSRAGLCLN